MSHPPLSSGLSGDGSSKLLPTPKPESEPDQMKPHSDISYEGNLEDVDQTQMTFDPKSSAFLMGLLTNLYSMPALACVREYSTNALDSNIAAGNSDPIVVTRPNALSPVFIVKDQGLGMSLETITEIYSKYGASTKRDSDLFNGMLGLGCKSALSYTSQFTLVSIYDKCKITVLITRNVEGGGMLQIIDQRPTEEKNGVEVQIPVSNCYSFNECIDDFFQYWNPGTVVGPGGETLVQSIWDDPKHFHLDDDVLVRDNFDDYILMGNVPYRVTGQNRSILHGRNGYVARVPIGTIKFTPSREALEYKGPTLDTLSEIRQFIVHTMPRRIRSEIEGCATPKEAVLKKIAYESIFSMYGFDPKYRGERIPRDITLPSDDNDDRFTSWKVIHKSWDSVKASRRWGESLKFLYTDTLFMVTGFKGRSLSDQMRRKLEAYTKKNFPDAENGNAKYVVLCEPDMKNNMWLEDVLMVDIETIKAVVLPKEDVPERITHTATEVRVLQTDGTYNFQLVKTITMGGWVSLKDKSIFKELARLFARVNRQIIVVPENSVSGFQKKYPQVPHVKDLFVAHMAVVNIKRRAANVPSDLFKLLNLMESSQSCMDFEFTSRLRELEKLRKVHRTWTWSYEDDLTRLARLYDVVVPKYESRLADSQWTEWFYDRYSFLKCVGGFDASQMHPIIIDAINNSYILRNQLHLINVL